MNSEKSSPTNTDDCETVRVFTKDGIFYAERNGWAINLSPPNMVKLSLPPYVEGMDWFLKSAAKFKNISPDSMKVRFSGSIFLGCDVRLESPEQMFGGWTYSVADEFLGAKIDRKIWMCPNFKLYYNMVPEKIFVSLEVST